MKKISFLMLMLCFSVFTKAQESRWKLLNMLDTTKQKTYIDSYRTENVQYLDGHKNVLVLWLRILSDPKQGEFSQQIDRKIAIDLVTNQLEIKAEMVKINGKEGETKQYLPYSWVDIYPETNEEALLFYCKKSNLSK